MTAHSPKDLKGLNGLSRLDELHDTELELPAPRVVRTAPLPLRALAALIDLVPPLLVAGLVTWLLVTTDPDPPPVAPWNLIDQVVDYLNDRPGRSLLAFMAFVALQVLWPLVFLGRTPGRRLLRLELIARVPLTLPRLLAWSALRVALLLPAGLGALWAIIDPERRTLYDRAAGLWLVKHPGPEAPTDPASA
ncbi:MAG TPA: RDD family protein [Myxococcota bacterium]|nr:RDD family protein [Myxococcota bacterium]